MGVRTCNADEKCRYFQYAHAGVERDELGAVEETDRGTKGTSAWYSTNSVLHVWSLLYYRDVTPVPSRAAILFTPSSYVDEFCQSPQIISSSC